MKKIICVLLIAAVCFLTACFDTADILSEYKLYSGDCHIHTMYSDGKNSAPAMAKAAYEAGLNFVYFADHNTTAAFTTYALEPFDFEDFIAVTGCEVSGWYGHCLAYNIDMMYDNWGHFEGTEENINDGPEWIKEIPTHAAQGERAAVYLAHPNPFSNQDLSWRNIEKTQGYTGLEIWNGNRASRSTIDYWDLCNIEGRKIYAIGNSDAHSADFIGVVRNGMYLKELSEKEINRALLEGTFYITNGPDMQFTINGHMMGSTVRTKKAQINIQLSSESNYIKLVRIIKNGEILQSYDYESQNLTELDLSLEDKSKKGDFYRIEVFCENGNEAYSNPIFIK